MDYTLPSTLLSLHLPLSPTFSASPPARLSWRFAALHHLWNHHAMTELQVEQPPYINEWSLWVHLSPCSISACGPAGSSLPPPIFGSTRPPLPFYPTRFPRPSGSPFGSCHTTSATNLRIFHYVLFLHPSGCSGLLFSFGLASVYGLHRLSLRYSGSSSDGCCCGVAYASVASNVTLLHWLSICTLGSIGSASIGHSQSTVLSKPWRLPPLSPLWALVTARLWVGANGRPPPALPGDRPPITTPTLPPCPPPKPAPSLPHLICLYGVRSRLVRGRCTVMVRFSYFHS